ncbi:anti sigma-E factor RseA C-terminal domain-containing protein [Pseudomonas sp. RTC3]|uniref:anti sigma-E factor RseA C-terminal domain-containing protein n=1 Tax=unclassified Pseudomonas TaxID=196821 RepID=UPI002AB52478|nr:MULTISPECIES: anti sigma-E factor RseA C-terminal domain-containing protein [unclassified Pseudomonas]MEB0064536.1 anti sigma-E factor RseA C-terminal domain-containing protein [Pseudomonas sp. RTC3]MDY7566243.1 anti sigma-E factor RseA C-terminal domain-containing protein [Pseudomonas sp. 5C2]MEB0005621.1 anti sigma-E factor RseA C-terminal domain-containing protein [Pseudomonas sp. RTB2]MEB0017210.1 anti sigma-E factor RseA C-terminal domain-containing protein [Pseudomonas sp. RTB3]MEB002
MSREALQESLSAVMDNEADELELRRVLNAFGDADTRATWSRYQVARAAMHKDLLLPHLDISAAVSAAIADEVTPLKTSRSPWRSLGRLAVAASVTVAVLAGVRLYNQDEIAGVELAQQAAQPANLSVPQVKGPAVLAGYNESAEQAPGPMASGVLQGQTGWHDQRLPGYLRQHAQQAALKGTESALPYARAASLENR